MQMLSAITLVAVLALVGCSEAPKGERAIPGRKVSPGRQARRERRAKRASPELPARRSEWCHHNHRRPRARLTSS